MRGEKVEVPDERKFRDTSDVRGGGLMGACL